MTDDIVSLLWTGGWDSTFRLLMLLLVYQRPVQPYYVIDPARHSTPQEMGAMATLRRALAERHAATRALLLPTEVVHRDEIAPDPAITAHYTLLKRRYHIGRQYDWLARFAAQRDLTGVEMGLQKTGKVAAILRPHVVTDTDTRGLPYARLAEPLADAALSMFTRFRFGMLEISKSEMGALARRHAFFSLMGCTWFCHTPLRNGTPCRVCTPCRFALQNGLGCCLPPLTAEAVLRLLARTLFVTPRCVLRDRLGALRRQVALPGRRL